jgi:hypothetical protein
MKKIFIFILLFIPLVSFSQGFFKPVHDNLTYTTNKRGINDTWLVRPIVQLSAMEIVFTDPVTVQPLNSLGTGISYSHFIQQNGSPYQNISANLLVLFGTEMVDTAPLKLSIAGTVTLWQYFSIGGGYNCMDKKFFILTGISYNFN